MSPDTVISVEGLGKTMGGRELFRDLDFTLTPGTRLGLGALWQRQSAVAFVQGQGGNALRWYADLSCRWPAHP